ncbi:Ornithine decarboxylase [Roseomonas mucosa]|uniref:ornithine decarboxylase n=1 Tax=Roseomonas mucosa TaxID=207340 RepID=A0A379N3X6_9PROT|nr:MULTISPECIES: type III PLP-dependent enzyme [Roseomonas]MBS5901577.1 type III PLP-dependent enzyme [Acetobacteraceae bacterium]MDT8263080.1 type III PLP-dependent enzyme [Roseomonas sp. DSM 102946]ATR19932.1 type III PLP-dependent enzyme [Roseomonas sp. FDAARGOS_362]MCG7350696.1 type III PLP-dependent enzyme [Roseomonas mucosa]MCG7355907.1 type III PLP-dependent enzyme [Roseomonas mucosa]
MTPKIAQFLRDAAPATPCLVLDVDRVEENYRRLQAAMPQSRIYYAVKANPAAPILDRLVGLGSSFDAASYEEISACLDAGAAPESISYGNTIKKESAIKAAFDRGIRMFAFDSEGELKKLARSAPGSRVYCRILVGNDGAEWPLSRKFGCEIEMAKALMIQAAELGLDPFGLSFHVGSQQTKTTAYEAAIAKAAMLFTDLQEAGVKVRMVNLGGGYPVRYRAEVPEIDTFGAAIMGAMAQHFGNALPDIVIEPGRFIVGDAGVVSAEVVLVSRKAEDDPVRWVYLDIGRFGGLAETEGESIKYDFRTPHDGEDEGPVTIAGPTCDSTDTLYEKSNYRLPLALDAGDRIELLATGAYVTTYASQRFNGFAPLAEHYV